MSKITYPAVFHKDVSEYWVEFPDLEGCFSNGNSLEEAYEYSKDALGLYLDKDGESYARKINKPSSLDSIINKYPNEIVMLVEYDSIEYAKKYKNKAVKKTLSIPEWLNDEALKANINFSSVLQEGLLKALNIK